MRRILRRYFTIILRLFNYHAKFINFFFMFAAKLNRLSSLTDGHFMLTYCNRKVGIVSEGLLKSPGRNFVSCLKVGVISLNTK